MTAGVLAGMRVVEGSAFVAAPLGGAILAAMGADVIRFDPIGGGIDHDRWPVTEDGFSLYWAGLNQGKRSITLDVSSPEGRDLALAIATAPGVDAGIALTNHPRCSWFSHEALVERRTDMITCHIEGHADGGPAVDYTINAATGLPNMTGPEGTGEPVNSVLPAWDVITGHLAVIALLGAERARRQSGEGDCVRVALADVAFGVMGHLGYVGEASVSRSTRPRIGNALYGGFGQDFETADGRRIMIVAITSRQFSRLVEALGLGDEIALLEASRGAALGSQGELFAARHELSEIMSSWFASRSHEDAVEALEAHKVLWGPYQNVPGLVEGEGRWSIGAAGFSEVDQPGVGTYPMPASPLRFEEAGRLPPVRAPRLGEHTTEVLEQVLGLGTSEIGRLHDRGVIA